jgi:CubicO group peptidase (beta-lactamase class C family)
MHIIKKALSFILVSFVLQLSLVTGLSAEEKPSLDGLWRGELEVQKGVTLAIGISISDNNASLTLNSPNQGMFEKVPSSFNISADTLSFIDEDLGASFEGQIDGDKINGIFTQGKAMSLTLQKLTEKDLERMKYEGKYSGDLIINANSVLPVVLHIAVIKDGYSAALDSPAQNSFGIPVDEVSIDDSKLTFISPMLNAKFSGQHDGSGYTGSFIQGMPMALTLTKVSDKNAHLLFEPPSFGEHGASVAIIENGQVQTKHLGSHTSTTQYEIGSITKTFVAYLLAEQITKNQVQLSSTIDTFFEGAKAISLQNLATHTSGLERNPPSLSLNADINNPFAHISRKDLQRDLTALDTIAEEASYEYSNFGYAVLGEALALNMQTSLSSELDAKVFKPLGMTNSYLADSPSKHSKELAKGFNTLGEAVNPWDFNAASGAGAIVSTLDDMLKYTQHMMTESKINSSIAQLLLNTYAETLPCCEQGLAWLIMEDKKGNKYAWHNGMTGGFSTFLGFYLDGSRAVVMLNAQAVSFDNAAHDLLTGEVLLQSI